jgi:DNA mismatch repair protein MutS2
MIFIPKKSLEDLEYFEVLSQVSQFAKTSIGKQSCLNIEPLFDINQILFNLKLVNEYKSSFDNENKIPSHEFEDCSSLFSILKIENSILDILAFKKISFNSETSNTILKFFIKFKVYYETLFVLSNDIDLNKEINKKISSIINRFDEINDSASEELFEIRKKIKFLKGKTATSFNKALSHYNVLDYLDEIRESIFDNTRVLAVKSMYRRKVKGAIMGGSKTGSIVFIEPESTNMFSRELRNLFFDESEEIKKILKKLTDFIRPFLTLIQKQQKFLLELDKIFALAKYAHEINGVIPNYNTDKKINLKNAFHPLLYCSNKTQNIKTFPQDISLNNQNRIIVISGPNAGGKSITLKTFGLLQLMFQSGILIPVHEKSNMSIFKKILTDIGDNQSIENQLSTYSYRLKNMKLFLKKGNKDTLFLIDEFGTGSDPELGGALAESILERFYENGSYGIITTHYSNLKVLANELPQMLNANMQFDNNTLEPMFNLITGQAGSSFTFEVAQKNGLPYSLINRAKKKIERGKGRFDETIAKLQKERSKMTITEKVMKSKELSAHNESETMRSLNTKLKSKLISYQELLDHNKKMILLGGKVNNIAEIFFQNNKKRVLISELLKIITIENSKRIKKKPEIIKSTKNENKKTLKEIQIDLVNIRKEKEKLKKETSKKQYIIPQQLKVGDYVRLHDGKSVGSIDSIKRNKAIVNFGSFTTHIDVVSLELVNKKT